MRPLLCLLALFTLPMAAQATPDDLSGGVLVAHYVPEITWCCDDRPPGGWCAAYEPYAIHELTEVLARIDETGFGIYFWFVLAGWELEEKQWCGTEYGLGGFDVNVFVIGSAEPCFPSQGLEIPSVGWPGPNEGTAFVTTDVPWTGNWVPVYFFGGYAYGYYGASTLIPIDVDPSTGFAGFASCTAPPVTFDVEEPQRGGMGINMDGIIPVFPVPEPFACCVGCDCFMLLEPECLTLGGIWLGEPYVCGRVNPCLPTEGACCVGGLCTVVEEAACALLGGQFMGEGTTCDPNPCPAVCCFDLPGAPHGCEVILQDDCLAAYGSWHPEWTTCEPNPCEYTPTQDASWGAIKNLYR